MKLKKIAALALAGVMAVSMLAGCATKPATDDTDKTETTTAGFTSDMIAALEDQIGDKDYVTVTADATLQKNLDAVVAAYGAMAEAANVEAGMMKVNSGLKTTVLSTLVGVQPTYDAATKAETFFSAQQKTLGTGYTQVYAAQQLADAAMKETAYAGSQLKDAFVKETEETFDVKDNGTVVSKYKVAFNYEVKVATAKVVNAVTGDTSYVAAYTVTRTPSKVDVPLK